MKTLNQILNASLPLLKGMALMGVVSLSSCGKDESSFCLPYESFFKQWKLYESDDFLAAYSSLEEDSTGIYREYSWYVNVVNICTDEHVDVDYLAFVKNQDVPQFSVSGSVFWFNAVNPLFQYESVKPLVKDVANANIYSEWIVKDNVGIKNAFGDGPGDVFIEIIIKFPTRGSVAADNAFVIDHVDNVSMLVGYYQHKN